MAVDQLMLKRHVPGGEPDQQQRGGQQPQHLPEGQRRKPAAVDRDDQHPGWQLAAPKPGAAVLSDPVALLLVQPASGAFRHCFPLLGLLVR